MKKTVVVLMVLVVVFSTFQIGFAKPVSDETAITSAGEYPWRSDEIDSDHFGQFASLAFGSNDRPYISYYDSENGDLRVAMPVTVGSGNCGPGDAWNCQTVDSFNDVGRSSSIAVSPDWPTKLGITYFDATYKSLKFVEYRCTLSFPSTCSWSDPIWIDQSPWANDSRGEYTDLVYDSSRNAHISYYSATYLDPFYSHALKYAEEVGSGGNCGGGEFQCDTIDSEILSVAGRYNSIALDQYGYPHLSYYSSGDLKFATLTNNGNCGPGNNWTCETVDGEGSAQIITQSSIYIADNGTAWIAYYNRSAGQIRMASEVSGSGNCGTGWYCETVDWVLPEVVYQGISLVAIDNNPVVAYMVGEDQGPSSLKYARLATTLGLMVGNCGQSDGYLFFRWQCDYAATSGNAHRYLAEWVSIDVNDQGRLFVAHSVYDDYYDAYSLDLAYQVYSTYLPLTLRK